MSPASLKSAPTSSQLKTSEDPVQILVMLSPHSLLHLVHCPVNSSCSDFLDSQLWIFDSRRTSSTLAHISFAPAWKSTRQLGGAFSGFTLFVSPVRNHCSWPPEVQYRKIKVLYTLTSSIVTPVRRLNHNFILARGAEVHFHTFVYFFPLPLSTSS